MTTNTNWAGMVPVDDTELFVQDSGGSGMPVLYLNGAYADLKHWQPIIGELGDDDWRHITFDERARGRSKQSADYSFEGCLRDIDAVLAARNVDRVLLAGWSMGAIIGVLWAARNPDRARGIVCVDGAMPYGLTGEEGRERIRKLFGRMRLMLPIASRFGLAARMSAAQHAEVNIEINELGAGIAPTLDRLACPVRYVLGTGDSLGSSGGEMEQVRKALDPVLARKPNIKVSAKVSSNHSKIMKKDFAAIADAVREVQAAQNEESPRT
ncbi:MAG: alpha/beta hydrolase [Microlunatus sp.]|nr:alpha/beta hydrolase [Microlunatus sp.]